MTNVSGSTKKLERRSFLFHAAVEALEKQGWTVERISGLGKGSVRRISKGSDRRKVSIRTTQDTWIAFPRTDNDNGWATLDEVDYVVASSVDDSENPKFALVHLIDANEIRDRFDRAYAARKAEGHSLPTGRGFWVSLYHKEAPFPVNRVGAGAGLDNPPIARVPLNDVGPGSSTRTPAETQYLGRPPAPVASGSPLTISEAKRLLALSLGVSESDIKITVSG